MTQFNEGDEIEVYKTYDFGGAGKITRWVKGKIVRNLAIYPGSVAFTTTPYSVQLCDGTRAVFDAEHIRAAMPAYDPDGMNQAVRDQLASQQH